ncbi:CGGC domain-containing protein [Desulfotomaculum arcticum]|uniref:CGGC domain-containing protein n=1 Tax=Desulfotruncus arcticus DSM 17038 TaxID=1121424 RepID=A0A1I2P6C8_9FIRM|nr:CGGC domain-containing protein [Desulfotruncus arcticus]SFG11668.1 CGGC domain-containing protein [Desulfotomaculum arcticum] [Desulfotruncus arcticus DSM 17038]
MARIGIITCSNVTQELGCVSSVCLSEIRERKGFFKDYNPTL